MTAISKHPKWRNLSSKDKEEIKRFKRLQARILERYEEETIKNNGFAIETPDFLIIAECYKEIYG